MAYFSPEKAFEEVKNRTTEAVQSYFPLEGKKQTLLAKKVWVDDNKDPDDVASQLDAKLKKRTWAVPIKAQMQLIDNKTGEVKDEKVVTVGSVPKVTRRHSYIVNGTEWQLANQLRLKSGVYNRLMNTGEISGQWNLENGIAGRGFTMKFDPKSRKMLMRYGSTNVGLYPVLKSLGVPDDEIEKQWGRPILDANKTDSTDVHLRRMYKAMTKKNPESLAQAQKAILDAFGKSTLRPDSTKVTLGKPFSTVNGEALLTGSNRLLKLARNEVPEDNRDSLLFKDVYSAEDLIQERLKKDSRSDILRRMKNTLDTKGTVSEVVGPDTFGRPIKSLFTSSTLSDRPDQHNPLSFIIGARKSTIMGKHGIESDEKLTNSAARLIDPSNVGFLDPIHTPESKRIGAITQFASGVKKVGKNLMISVINAKTGKREDISPSTALHSNLAFPGQHTAKNGKPVATDKLVTITDKKGDIVSVNSAKVDYILPSTKGMYDITANTVPFLQSDQGNRASMATRQMEQAVPLVANEAPLVQVKGEGSLTFEQAIGKLNSHKSPVSGTVMSVEPGAIKVKAGRKTTTVPIYDNFPLNDGQGVINARPVVAVGDKVKKDQLLADTSFTKGGVFALGTNLRTAYIPWKGINFEDGIVISAGAAKKLTSEHLHRVATQSNVNTVLDKNKFFAETAGKYSKEQADKLDDGAVVKVGTILNPGDIVIGEMVKTDLTREQKSLGLFSRKALKPMKVRPKTWEQQHPGEVVRVVKHGKDTTVYVKTRAPAEIGDKLVGRHANKGIISDVVPDNEMPRDANGNVIDILMNPAGIPTRINVGQALETAAGKLAEKRGSTYIVNNFDPNNKDYTRNLQKEMKAAGVPDVEDLKNPTTGETYKNVLTGRQYVLKLHHTAEKKLHARSRGGYTNNRTAQAGGDASGQSMDMMGMYALLAHGAKANVREMQTFKSDMNDEVWDKLQTGQPVPTPEVPFVYKKFEGMLRAAGIDVNKNGNTLSLQPLTDKGTERLSNGEIKEPWKVLRAKDAAPEKNGLFDPTVTGTSWPHGDLGNKWGHIRLSERMPNPVFEHTISALTGIKQKDIEGVIAGKTKLSDGKTGPKALVAELARIDVASVLPKLEEDIKHTSKSKLDAMNKKIKYLRGLKATGLTPVEAYTMSKIPVLPPNMRPLTLNPSGDISEADVNGLYKGIGAVEYQLRTADKSLPDAEKHELTGALYDGMKALTLTGATYKDRYRSGIIPQIAGSAGKKKAKEAFFQDKVMGRRQDMSMRGTITPNPDLSLDEVGLPRKAAQEIYKPFTTARLVSYGYTPLQAQRAVRDDTIEARKALEDEARERPVLLKRDPVLHKYGVQAFTPRITEKKTIEIHPLVTGGFNADFDGDTMSAFVPVGKDAISEAYKMMPSHNLFNSSTGDVMFRPGHESLYGLYKLTEMGKDKGKVFNTAAEAARSVKDGKTGINEVVTIKGGKTTIKTAAAKKTTVGRMMFYNALPKSVQSENILVDPKFKVNKSELRDLLSSLGVKSPQEYSNAADDLKNIGNSFATGKSIGLSDFNAYTGYRDEVLKAAKKKEMAIRGTTASQDAKDKKIIDLYRKSFDDIERDAKKKLDKSGNRMYDWAKSGARGNWGQFKQMNVAPGLVTDSLNRTVAVPITKSYSEGLDAAGYWTAMHGARMGTIGRVLGTSEPGVIFKQLVTSSMNQVITEEDCGTHHGVRMAASSSNVLDRFLAKSVSLGVKAGADKGSISAGTLITPEIQARLVNNKVKDIVVRSPLRCEAKEGVCAKCAGLHADGDTHSVGTNVGIISAQALGAPLTQMSMDAFHSGGVSSGGATAVDKMTRVKQLTQLPLTLPGSAVLSEESGAVTKVDKDPAGGWGVTVNGKRHFVPTRNGLQVSEGTDVKKGTPLSGGDINPRELMDLTNVHAVQKYLTDELSNAYGSPSPLHRRNTEVLVRAMTGLTKVKDPGSHQEFLPGDTASRYQIEAYNKNLSPGEKPIEHAPILKGTAILPVDLSEDWLARMQTTHLKSTLLEGVARGWKSDIHGLLPVPGMAYGAEFGKGTKEKPWGY